MSHAHSRSSGGKKRAPRNGPHHVIIARGNAVRSFAVRPLSVVLAAIFTIGVVSGSLTVAALAIFKNDSQVTAATEQNRIRQQYELQLADLHRQMDALVSRQLVERELLNNQVVELLDRQGQLIERQQLLTGLATDALAAGIDVLPMLAPLPRANPLRSTEVEGGIGGPIDPTTTGATGIGPQASVSHSEALAAVEMTADWLSETQIDALALLAGAISDRSDELASLLRQLGYSPAGDDGGVGGPFEPAFGVEEIDLVTDELAALEQLQAFARGLPLSRPLTQLQVTSSFGRRLDPFLGESAVHTGVDFRAPSGTSVMATGPGIVTEADVTGGYGKMVEIDHGNGVTTRYAHLSSILVDVGDAVTTGMIIGRAGSTGRSTGPHLHYEIRRNDTPFDPMPHLRTGPQIVNLL